MVRLTRFYAQNLLTFGKDGFEWEDIRPLNVVVGPNGSGKTNILRLIELVGNSFYFRHPGGQDRLVRTMPAADARIVVGLRFARAERQALVDLVLTTLRVGETNWQSSVAGVDHNEAERTVREIIALRSDDLKDIISENASLCVIMKENPTRPIETFVEFGTGRNQIVCDSVGFRPGPYRSITGWSGVEVKKPMFEAARKRYPNLAVQSAKDRRATADQLKSISISMGKRWLRRRLHQTGSLPTNLNLSPIQLRQFETAHGAETSEILGLRSFISELGWGANEITIMDLIGLIFRASLVRLSDIRSRPIDTPLGLPPSELDVQRVRLIDGASLASELFEMKTHVDPNGRQLFNRLVDFYERLIQLRPDVVQYVVSDGDGHQTRYASLRVAGPGYEVPLDYAAAGHVELLVFLYALNSVQDGILLLDEPAANLHPVLQGRLFREMISRSRALRNQILAVTHSPAFVDTNQLDTVVRVNLSESGSSQLARFRSRSPGSESHDRRWLQTHPQLLAALFARGVVLVEGPQEAASLPIWFAKCGGGNLFSDRGIAVISVDGKGNFAHFSPVLDNWSIPYRVIGDGDAGAETSVYRQRGRSYPQRDLTVLFRQYERHEFERVLASIGTGAKDPAVAREVALRTRPPPPVRALWRWLKPFVFSPSDVTNRR